MSLKKNENHSMNPILHGGVPEGYEPFVLEKLVREQKKSVLFILRDDRRMEEVKRVLSFFTPKLRVVEFPAWDCVPYDRVSPRADLMARRLETLTMIADGQLSEPFILLTTVNAILQRVPPKEVFKGVSLCLRRGDTFSSDKLIEFFASNGFLRVETVREQGEFAVRGGIMDLFSPGQDKPIRLDFFGDDIESIRSFDPMTQRSLETLESLTLKPASEVLESRKDISRFRSQYGELFGSKAANDPLYESVSAGKHFPGQEHWLPLFYQHMSTIFDYVPDACLIWDYQWEVAVQARLEQIQDHYEARVEFSKVEESTYRPLPSEYLYLKSDELLPGIAISPFAAGEEDSAPMDMGGRPIHAFSTARILAESRGEKRTLLEEVLKFCGEQIKEGRRVLMTALSDKSARRLQDLFKERDLAQLMPVGTFKDLMGLPQKSIGVTVLELEKGFLASNLCVLTEQDIFGERLIPLSRTKKQSADKLLEELSSFSEGDYVVHIQHGIGKYEGLETLQAGGTRHDCLKVLYDGDDKLFVPVENIDVLSRYGSEDTQVKLDRLGGAGWQMRKARVKKRIKEIADKLMKIAAERQLRKATAVSKPSGLYEEFCTRFPFPETDDQFRAIEETIEDIAKDVPMDRLICGDVGFGKTEVALRSAFVVAAMGKQVAIVVPTTLLCRQHFKSFKERFVGFGLRVEQISRLVTQTQVSKIKKEVEEGCVDILVATQGIFSKSTNFKNLGLLVVDEEQHFGVVQKERLKERYPNVHVLTLTATPIPRTLQMALTGVREMSLIATPPIDRLAVRTFVMPFDGMILREAILREQHRNGQVFYVCPRIQDLGAIKMKLSKIVPEAKVAMAHGQMPSRQLEDVMTGFYDGKYDVLLSTNIIESGIDIPTANTLIVHRADMWGLAQLYQLRGRVGRSKLRAYAYLTITAGKSLTKSAQKRLEVMQTLDGLGAGFSLASHDLDIRGAGNLVGEEQSGHVKEVGVELYQHMLQEAVHSLRETQTDEPIDEGLSPQINLGVSIMIPENYVSDLGLRMGLYRRLGHLKEPEAIQHFQEELQDRFGDVPEEVKNLLNVVHLKNLAVRAGVEKIDVGSKGVVIAFYKNMFDNPLGLVEFINDQKGTVKLRPDHKLGVLRAWASTEERMAGLESLLKRLGDFRKSEEKKHEAAN